MLQYTTVRSSENADESFYGSSKIHLINSTDYLCAQIAIAIVISAIFSSFPQDLFLFDKNALHPKWDAQLFKGELVDIYYIDQTPKRVVALQSYDQFGVPLTKYTTSDYQPNQQSTPVTNAGFDIGVVLSMIGLLMIGFAVYKAIQVRQVNYRP